jgi:NAD-dependent protein deacetylase/lipoamidase
VDRVQGLSADDADRARAVLQGAERVVVLTGAGTSAESGVPTFRGEEGLWRSFRPEELATPEAFARDPELVWTWYRWRRSLVADCSPNPGHVALARFALRHGATTIVTQNVDGLHTRAAIEAADVGDPAPALPLELHGAIGRDRCSACGAVREALVLEGPAEGPRTIPRCPICDGPLRPDVVWFGEALDAELLERAFERARGADVCLVVGTSAVVQPAASIPITTLERGGALIEVNPEPTPLTPRATISLRGKSGPLLGALLDPA